MENENGNANPQNGEDVVVDIEDGGDDVDALKGNLTKLQEQNKKLFARAKRAEGFEFRDDKWIKKESTEAVKETKPEAKPDDKLFARLEKLAFSQAGITHQDDVELARTTAKKWNMEVEDVLADEDFKIKLEKQQTNRQNLEATTKIKGGSASPSKAKESPEYWIAKGTPPTPEDVPDRKVRAKILRAMMSKSQTSGKTFYND